jgi:hypothetical protein
MKFAFLRVSMNGIVLLHTTVGNSRIIYIHCVSGSELWPVVHTPLTVVNWNLIVPLCRVWLSLYFKLHAISLILLTYKLHNCSGAIQYDSLNQLAGKGECLFVTQWAYYLLQLTNSDVMCKILMCNPYRINISLFIWFYWNVWWLNHLASHVMDTWKSM